MHFKNGITLRQIRHVHVDLTVKTTSPHQRAVQDVCTVRCRQNDDTTVGTKTVHLGQQLVQRILPLIIGTQTGVFTSGTANSINLINKNDAWTLVFGLLKKVPDTAGADAHEHFYKIRSAQRKERNLSLPRHGFGQECFSGSRRSNEQSALWNLRPKVGVLIGILQELHNLSELLFGPFQTCNVVEVNLCRVVFIKQLRLRLPNIENLTTGATATPKTAHQHHPNANHNGEHDDVKQELLAPFIGTLVGHDDPTIRRKLIQSVNVLF